jgi:hypothetical protein
MKKAICKHCVYPCKRTYAAECNKFTSFNYESAKKEYKELLISKTNNKRLEELKTRIMNINGGIL